MSSKLRPKHSAEETDQATAATALSIETTTSSEKRPSITKRPSLKKASVVHKASVVTSVIKIAKAGDGIRTHDNNVGNVVLYQLSYARNPYRHHSH
jgi:hypothetical protein